MGENRKTDPEIPENLKSAENREFRKAVSTSGTLTVTHVFDTIKDNFAIPGGHLELILEERYDEIVKFLDDHFMTDEPWFYALGLKIGPYTNRQLARLRQNVSIMAVRDKSSEIIGVFTSDVKMRSEKVDINSYSDESMREMFKFKAQKEPAVDIFDKCGE